MTQLVITQGDPAGIGPELLLRLAAEGALRPEDRVIAGLSPLRELASRHQGWARRGLERILPLLDRAEAGIPDQLAQFAALERGVDLILAGSAEAGTGAESAPALLTAPIDKALAQAEGLAHPGHTEYLAARSKVRDFAMLMSGDQLRVALATIHLPLREVAERLDEAAIVRAASLLGRALIRDFGVERPRVGVLALNPHAGERGLLGDEEITIIEPALAALKLWAQQQDLPLEFVGPLPADTAFHQNRSGALDGLVAMYHDQGLGPFKLIHFSDGVNVTLGLPFVRTSPDHGTAKDIAGRGIADPSSMLAALALARSMAASRSPT